MKDGGARVRLDTITKRFGRTLAVDAVSLTVEPGEFLTLLGPSGCGKTTTLRMVAGLEEPTAGRVLIDDEDVTDRPPQPATSSMVFQSYALFPHLSVFENVAYGLRVLRRPADEVRHRVGEALALVGLGGFGERQPAQLSGGQQQRVALARALVLQPEGPAVRRAALEPRRQAPAADARRDPRRCSASSASPRVYVTHDQAEALAIAGPDRGDGPTAGSSSRRRPHEIYGRPATRFVADFIGEANLLPVAVEASGPWGVRVRLGAVTLSVPGGAVSAGAATLVARPEAIQIRPAAPASAPDGALAGEVRQSANLGAAAEYAVDTEVGVVAVTDAVMADGLLAAGSACGSPSRPIVWPCFRRELREAPHDAPLARGRFGVSAWIYGDAAPQTFARIKAAGFDGVELPGEPGRWQPAELRRWLGDHGLAPVALTASCWVTTERDLAHPDARVRAVAVDYVERCLGLAAEIGAPLVQMLASGEPRLAPIASRAEEWAWSVAGMQTAAREAERIGVRITVEPLNRYEAYLVTSASEALAYLDAVGSPSVGMTLRPLPREHRGARPRRLDSRGRIPALARADRRHDAARAGPRPPRRRGGHGRAGRDRLRRGPGGGDRGAGPRPVPGDQGRAFRRDPRPGHSRVARPAPGALARADGGAPTREVIGTGRGIEPHVQRRSKRACATGRRSGMRGRVLIAVIATAAVVLGAIGLASPAVAARARS